jgi:SAM-dependent methyltransferase
VEEQGVMGKIEPASYAAWFESPLGRRVWEDERAALRQLLGPPRGQQILDAGAGDGRLARELAEGDAEVVALDRSHAMSMAASFQTRAGQRPVIPVTGDALALPFRDHAFDTVVAVTLLCFLENPADAVREMARVVRPGGKVVVGDLGRWSAWALGRRLGSARKRSFWREVQFWTTRELRDLLDAAELAPAGARSAVFYPPSLAAARAFKRLERHLGHHTDAGAAFIAVVGLKRGDGGTLDGVKRLQRRRMPWDAR